MSSGAPGAMRAAIAVRADVDRKGAGRNLDLVDAEQEGDIQHAGLRHLDRAPPAFARQ